MDTFVPPLHTHTLAKYKNEEDNNKLWETLENDRLEVHDMVNDMLNTLTTFKEKFTFFYQDLHGFIVEESISSNVEEHFVEHEAFPLTCISANDVDLFYSGLLEHVVECEDLPLTCINADDVDPISSGLLEHVVECEDIPFTYISMDMVEQQDFMEYSC